jgi:hypothetical protein
MSPLCFSGSAGGAFYVASRDELESWTYFDLTNGTYVLLEDHDARAPRPAEAIYTDLCEALAMTTTMPSRPRVLAGPRISRDHDVRLSTNNLRVAGIDLDFDVKLSGKVLGTLSVSEGGLRWRAAHTQKKNGIPIPWSEFRDWAES